MQFLEGLDLQQIEDASVLGPVPAGLHQPAVDLLSRACASGERLLEGGLRMCLQVLDQPQLERVHPRQKTAVVQVEFLRRVPVEKRCYRGRIERLVGHIEREPRTEFLRRHRRPHRAQRHRHRARRELHAVQQRGERVLEWLAAVLLVEPPQENPALAVGEALEVLLAYGRRVVLQQPGRAGWIAVHVVVDHLAHDADEHQVHGAARCLGNREDATVIVLVEVGKGEHAAAGVKRLPRARGKLALHRGIERLAQAGARICPEIIQHPRAQVVARVQREQPLGGTGRVREFRVCSRDQLEPAQERAQLGGGSEIELGAGIDVQRLVQIVGVDAQPVHALAALVEREAVNHLRGIGSPHQMLAVQPQLGDALRARERTQEGGDLVLHRRIQRGAGIQIETIEFIQAVHAEQAKQLGACQVDPFLLGVIDQWRGAGTRAERERCSQRGLSQRARNDAVQHHAPEVTISECGQSLRILPKVVRGSPHREHQRQHLLEVQGALLDGGIGR